MVGFGNRIHRADFGSLVTIGPPLRLHSKETKAREGPKRVVLRYEFRVWQEERLVYFGEEPGRAVPADTLVKNAIAEMRDLKVGDESKLRIWQAEMRKVIPNVANPIARFENRLVHPRMK